jgi:purine-binding chemotaxis protein CheW
VPWGLAVDSVTQPISLLPEDVKWRSDRSKRPWLAGTVKEHMCALLDIPMIAQMLMSADKNALKNHS